MAQTPVDFSKELPSDICGWRTTEIQVMTQPKELFRYINGGAELYLSYGFQRLYAMEYQNKQGEQIKVDIFELGSSYDAYGVFAHGRETQCKQFGQGSEYSSGLLNFFKDNYYISVVGYPESDEKKKIILQLGTLIDRLIPKEGPAPPLVNHLPTDHLVPESVRYFRHYIWLNTHYYIASENILNIDKNTQAVLAKYTEKNGHYFLCLLVYPDETRAQSAQTSFLKQYLPDAKAGLQQTEDGRFTGIARKKELIGIVFNASKEDLVKNLLKKTVLEAR